MVCKKAGVRLGIGKLVSFPLFLIAWVVLFGLQPVSSSAQSNVDEEALLALATQTWKGDLEDMHSRGFVRVLTVYNPLFFYYDGGDQKGVGFEITQAFAEELNKKRTKGTPPIRFLRIPVARDRLLPGLIEGKGDIVAANLTITPERQEIVQFADPTFPGVSELVVTGPSAPEVASFDHLVEVGVYIRESSSYFEHLNVLNAKRKSAGQAAIPVQKVDENLEDHDLLEMVNAGLIPAVIVDSHKVALWAKVFDQIKVHENLAVNKGGNIAWAVRKDSPQLLAEINSFMKGARKGTLLGNIIFKRYLANTKWVDNALSGDGWKRYQDVLALINEYAGKYDFDWLMIMAQGYQESKLDQSKISPVGAVGIMQVMPSTAADPIVGIPDISDPGSNVHAGIKYLRWLRETDFDEPEIDRVDRVLFSFAAYNAGPGAIRKARRRAEKMGFDPNRWFGHVEVAAAKTISQEPVIYVRNIYKYYVSYKLHEKEKAKRDAAKANQD